MGGKSLGAISSSIAWIASVLTDPEKAKNTASTRASILPLRSKAIIGVGEIGRRGVLRDAGDLGVMQFQRAFIGRREMFGFDAVQRRSAKGRGPVFQKRVHLISQTMVTSALTLCSPIATGTAFAIATGARMA